MMNVRPIITVIAVVLASFFFRTSVHAATLTIDEEPTLAGLTFVTPLRFLTPHTLNSPLHIHFGNEPTTKIILSPTNTVLTPSITPLPSPLLTTLVLLPTAESTPATPTLTTTPTPEIPKPTTISPTPTSIPQQMTSPANPGGLDAEKLFAMSNTYRASKGLPPFQKDERACQLAATRAPEVNTEIAEGRMHSGLRERNLPYWNSENIISYHSEEAAFNWWINDTIHREQIEGNYTYSCVACAGNACAQEFTNFQMK